MERTFKVVLDDQYIYNKELKRNLDQKLVDILNVWESEDGDAVLQVIYCEEV